MSDIAKATTLPDGYKIQAKQIQKFIEGDPNYTVEIGGKRFPVLLRNPNKMIKSYVKPKKDFLEKLKQRVGNDIEEYKKFLAEQNLAPNIFSNLNQFNNRKEFTTALKNDPLYAGAGGRLRGQRKPPSAPPGDLGKQPQAVDSDEELARQVSAELEEEEEEVEFTAPGATGTGEAKTAPAMTEKERIAALAKQKAKEVKEERKKRRAMTEQQRKEAADKREKDLQERERRAKEIEDREKAREKAVKDRVAALRAAVVAEMKAIERQKQINIEEKKRLDALKAFQARLRSLAQRRATAALAKAVREQTAKINRLLNRPVIPVAETVPETVPDPQVINEEEQKLEAGEPFDPEKVQRTEQDGRTIFGQRGAMELQMTELDEEKEAQEEDAADQLQTDNLPDISKYGHQKSISMICIANGRDFTYYKNLVKNNVALAPSEDKAKRKKEAKIMEMEYGIVISWEGFKTDYEMEEVLELYTIVTVFKEVLAEERQWKRAIIKLQKMTAERNMPSEVGGSDLGVVMPLDAFGVRPQDLINVASARSGPDDGESKQPPGTGESKTASTPPSTPTGTPAGTPVGTPVGTPTATPTSTPPGSPGGGMFKVEKKIKGSSSMAYSSRKKKPSVRQPKDLNPQNLAFRTGTRFNPNLLMSLGRVGYDSGIPSVDNNQFSYNRVMEAEKKDSAEFTFRVK